MKGETLVVESQFGSSMTSSLIGLLGVLIGSIGTLFLGLRQQRADAKLERERRDDEARWAQAQREEERRSAEQRNVEHARVAARMLQSDLTVARMRLRAAIKNDKFWGERFALPLDAWSEYREIVAMHMPLPDWMTVSACFRSLSSTELQASAARETTGDLRPTFTDRKRRQVELGLRRTDRALLALERFSGDSAEDSDELPADDEGSDDPIA